MATIVVDPLKYYSTTLFQNKDYLSLETNAERLEFILRFVKPLREYRAEMYVKADNYRERHRKSLEKSLQLRAKGRLYF